MRVNQYHLPIWLVNFSHSTHELSVETAEASTNQRLSSFGGRIYSESRTFETTRGNVDLFWMENFNSEIAFETGRVLVGLFTSVL